jgi:glycosyltransferase involved in cell wall biosynthesis
MSEYRAANRSSTALPSGGRTGPLKLSVIIPVYNEVISLPIILNRVVAAVPHVEKEIIVVDDCSTEGTTSWCDSQ